jgi:hypothetical protein
MSWIALEDVVRILKLCLERAPIQGTVNFAPISGPVNLVSPQPVTNAEFTETLASALHRPAIFPAPPFALRVVLGREMADALLMASQRVVPKKLENLGYAFRQAKLGAALHSMLSE